MSPPMSNMKTAQPASLSLRPGPPAPTAWRSLATGKAAIENGELKFWRLRVSERQFNQEYTGGFGEPECWKCTVPIVGEETAHIGIMSNWVEAILKGTPLLAPGGEGINGLELSNAMYLSTWTDSWVELPIDHDRFYEELQQKIKNSTFKKPEVESKLMDVSKSY